MPVTCPCCGHIVFEQAPTKHASILKAIRDFGPIRSSELAMLVYGRDDKFTRDSIKSQVSIMNRYNRMVDSDGKGPNARGYRIATVPPTVVNQAQWEGLE